MDDRSLHENNRQSEIWTVGGGKGGTGKTFVICQLAMYLASLGKEVILIDTDFGGSNVHSFFGIKNKKKSLSKFFDEKVELENLVIDTQIKNLYIIPGSTTPLAASNISYTQKAKLFRHIKQLNADYILLDLGGGTSFDTLDVFLLADKMIAVVVPEITAIENLYQFIKSAYLRKLKSIFVNCELKDTAKDIWENRADYGIKTIVDLLEYLKKTSIEMDGILSKELAGFSLNIILKQDILPLVKELQILEYK